MRYDTTLIPLIFYIILMWALILQTRSVKSGEVRGVLYTAMGLATAALLGWFTFLGVILYATLNWPH